MPNDGPQIRIGGSRSKSGCLTCRRRRVKCDEQRPVCKNCLKGNRVCESNDSRLDESKKDLKVVIYHGPELSKSVSSWPEIKSSELRSLERFVRRTAPQLAGPFSPEFWRDSIMQGTQHHQGLVYAVTALNSLLEQFEQGISLDNSDYALQQYGKAIRNIIQLDPKNSSIDSNIAMIASTLFMACESIQGHYYSATTHVVSGLKMLYEMQPSKPSNVSSNPLQLVMTRLDTQSTEMANMLSDPVRYMLPHPNLIPVPSKFISVEEAQASLDVYYNHLLHILIDVMDPLEIGQFPDGSPVQSSALEGILADLTAIQSQHVQYFETWKKAFAASGFSPSDPRVMIVEVYAQLIQLVQSADFTAGEQGWDNDISHFSNVLDSIERFILATQGAHSTKRLFTMSAGIVCPLYFVGDRCRDPIIRRRVLKLLTDCDRQEGLWDSRVVFQALQKLISIEESNSPGPVHTASDIPEYARVTRVEVILRPSEIEIQYYKGHSREPCVSYQMLN